MGRSTLDVIAQWTTLRALGTSKILRSSSIWLILVPLAVKVLQEVDNWRVALEFIPGEPEITVALPFSWQLFFFGALFTSAGNLIYLWKCPPVIRDYESFHDYAVKGGRGAFSLLRDYRRWYGLDMTLPFGVMVGEMNTATVRDALTDLDHVEIRDLGETFAFVRDDAETERPFSRIICVVLYGSGLAFFGFVLLQNLFFVLQFILT